MARGSARAGVGGRSDGRGPVTSRILRSLVLKQPLFTSRDAADLTGASPTVVAHALERLTREGFIAKLLRGVWANTSHPMFSPYLLVGHLQEVWAESIYVSFVSALHLHGMLSQIPHEIHVAVARKRRVLMTPVAKFAFHKLPQPLLTGYAAGDAWGRFQMAIPEKALFDTLYLSLRRGRPWRHLPEVELPGKWNWSLWEDWLDIVDFEPHRRALARLRTQLQLASTRSGRASDGP